MWSRRQISCSQTRREGEGSPAVFEESLLSFLWSGSLFIQIFFVLAIEHLNATVHCVKYNLSQAASNGQSCERLPFHRTPVRQYATIEANHDVTMFPRKRPVNLPDALSQKQKQRNTILCTSVHWKTRGTAWVHRNVATQNGYEH